MPRRPPRLLRLLLLRPWWVVVAAQLWLLRLRLRLRLRLLLLSAMLVGAAPVRTTTLLVAVAAVVAGAVTIDRPKNPVFPRYPQEPVFS
jgi:hypothetical protein